MDFFFYGTLRDPRVLAAVMGRPWPPAQIVAARAEGFACVKLRDLPYATLKRRPGAATVGAVVRGVGAGDAARLRRYEGSLYGQARIGVVLADGGRRMVQVFLARPDLRLGDDIWAFEDWAKGRGAERLLRRIKREYGSA